MSKKLLDQVRQKTCLKPHSIRAEQAYVNWIRKFIPFHKIRHPDETAEAEIESFLTYLAVDCRVALLTKNQAIQWVQV